MTLFKSLLVFYAVAVCSCTLTTKVQFNKLQTCPLNTSLNQLTKLTGAHDSRTCFVECAAVIICSVLYRTASESVCYFGNAAQLKMYFSNINSHGSDECVSYVRYFEWSHGANETVTGGWMSTNTTLPTAEITMQATVNVPGLNSGLISKLVILFDFRQGYTNLVNPAKYSAMPMGSITRDWQGAHFPGGSNSNFIEVNTDGNTLTSTYLDNRSNFTFFARVVRQTYYQQTYHYFYNCSTTADKRGMFADNSGKLMAEHSFHWGPNYNLMGRQTIGNPLSTDNVPQLASVGVVFVGSTLSNFYFNGSFIGAANPTGFFNPSQPPLCLRLGFNNDPWAALRGQFICYAIAKDALDLSELQQLDAFCGN